MGDYTKLNINEINEIVGLYRDSEVSEFRPLSLGISNSNYEVKIGEERLLLKVSNDKNAEQLSEEMKILHFLKNKSYKYSLTPLETKDNTLVYQTKKYYGVIFPFIEGIPPGPNDATCYEIGKALASLHSVKGPFEGLRPSEELSYPESVIHDYINSEKCPSDFKDTYLELLGENSEHYLEHSFERGIIHGDLYYDNTLFDNNHLACVLDFEQSGVGNYILDLGISISGCCLEKGRISLELMKSYLSGYESVRRLTLEEIEFLTDAVIYGLFSIALWRIKRFKEGNLNPLMEDSYKQLLFRAKLFKMAVENG